MRLRLVCLVVALASAAALYAQDTATLAGSVKDQSGATIANAAVEVVSPERGLSRTTVTNQEGEFSLPALTAGSYDLRVTVPGFKRYDAKGVILRVAQKSRVDVMMQVGDVSTEINVEGTSVAQVETQSSDLSGTVTGKQITQLELNGRNFTQLVTLVPGVSNQTGQDEGTVGISGNVAFSINGGRTEYNNWELDGGDNMDNGSNTTLNVYPSLEAIAEFKVLTSNYGAQYGRNGSGTVEVETKSGTNAFHGNVYSFVRNDIFNAKSYFQSSVPAYKKNDFGYTIGGPVYIPGVYNRGKDKTFFFWSEEWRRDRVPGQTFFQPVPSNAERSGDFSDLCPNPATSTAGNPDFSDCPKVNGVYTPSLTTLPDFIGNHTNAQALLALIPTPTSGTAGAEVYQAAPTQPTNWREELIRVDHNLSSKHRATFRYIHDSWDTLNATPLWTNSGSFPTVQTKFQGPGVSLVTRLTSTFSPTLLNEFVFSYTTDHIVLTNVGNWKRGPNVTIGSLFPGSTFNGSLPGIQLNGGNAYGQGFGEDPGYIPNGPYNSNPTYTYRDNISQIIGKHNLTYGAYFVAAQKNEFGGELAAPAGSVPGFLTFDPTQSSTTTGNPFADLLLGYIASYGQQSKFIKYYNRYKVFEPYVQDDWHVTPHLTLNLGLRISFFGTYREKFHQAFNFDPSHYVAGQTVVNPDGTVSGLTANGLPPSVNNLPNGIVQCGVTKGVPVSCMRGHLFNPAPRIGFAWDPRGDGKMAVRGGYGIFFEHGNGIEGTTESLENSPPLATALVQNNVVGYTNIGSVGGTVAAQLPLSVVAIPNRAVWPYVQQWHLDLQREVLRNTVATLSYVGTKGTHLSRRTEQNQLQPLAVTPYAPGEAISSATNPATGFPIDCGQQFDQYGVPTSGATPVGNVPIGYGGAGVLSPAVYLGIAACGVNADPFRPYQGYSGIDHYEYAASSSYHALQLAVRRNVGGVQLNFSYTYSHSIDDSSSVGDRGFLDTYHLNRYRASSNFDQRHILTAGYIWDLPFFKKPGLSHTLVGGWQYSGIADFSTGSPFSVTYTRDNAGTGNGLASSPAYPDRIGNPKSGIVQTPLAGFGPLLYNPNAFTDPRGLTFGNAGRNVLNNPKRINFDMALFKHFAIKERLGVEFRAEAFNVFNHTQWGFLGGDGGSAASNSTQGLSSGTNSFGANNFLYIGTAHNARILQLGAKFIF